jgi:hypothetical protein
MSTLLRRSLLPLAFGALLAGAAPARAQFHGAPEQPDTPLDAATKTAVLDRVVAGLDTAYVDPALGQKIIRSLRDRQKAHAYDAITSSKAYAESLTVHLRAVSHDRHLRVQYRAEPFTDSEFAEPTAEEIARQRREIRQLNYGVDAVRRLPGNVGYLDLRMFVSPHDGSGDVLVAAMNFLAGTDALIVDVRRNGGGDPETVQLLCSYLFSGDEPVHLNDLYFRPRGTTTQFWTLPYVPGARYAGKPVYVLTSHSTGSGAEEFSYDVQTQKRATLVGETTAGAAHPGEFLRVGDHFAAFVATGRAINPITHDDWEGKGVKPDVATSADQALRTAHKAALQALLAKADEDGEKQRLTRALDAADVMPDPFNDPRPGMPAAAAPAAH